MRLETSFTNNVTLKPETPDERELCEAIVEVLRTGGDIRAIPRNKLAPRIRLVFDGDPSECEVPTP